MFVGPVRTDCREEETHGGIRRIGDGDLFDLGQERGRAQSMIGFGAAEDLHRLFAGHVSAENVLFPAWWRLVGWQVELVLVSGEVTQAEFGIRHGKETGCEVSCVRLSFSIHMPRSPTTVYEFPFSIVDLHCVPGVPGVVWWDGRSRLCWGETVSFTVASDDDAF